MSGIGLSQECHFVADLGLVAVEVFKMEKYISLFAVRLDETKLFCRRPKDYLTGYTSVAHVFSMLNRWQSRLLYIRAKQAPPKPPFQAAIK